MSYFKGKVLSFLLFGMLPILWAGCHQSPPGRNLLSLLFLSSGALNSSTSETLITQQRLGGIGLDRGYSIITDSSGNLIVGGSAEGNGDFNGDGDTLDGGAEDPGALADEDAMIVKFDSERNVIWARRLGGTGVDRIYGIAVDAGDNVFVTGHIVGDADINGDGDFLDGGAEDSSGYGSSDIFVAKFDVSGTFQWARRLGGTGQDRGRGIITDSSGGVVITGLITGNADLNGDGDALDGGPEDSSGYGGEDLFISSFDANGNFQWAKRLGGTSSDNGYSLHVDSLDNIILSGRVSGAADLNGDGDALDGGAEDAGSYGGRDVCLVQFDSSGVFQWARRLGGAADDQSHQVTVDSGDNVIVAGRIDGDGDLNGDGDALDGGAEDSSAYGLLDVFVSKFDSAGNFQWSRRLGGALDDYGYGLSTDPADNVILVGQISGDADLNADGDTLDGNGEDSSAFGDGDIFVSIFNASGTHQWSTRLGGTNDDMGQGITSTTTGTITLTGFITGTADLNGDGDFLDDAEDGSGFADKDLFVVTLDWQ